MVTPGGPWATVPELLFEKKGLIPALQQLLVSRLAGSRYLPTAWETGGIATAGLLLPLVFAYSPIILLQPLNPFIETLILMGFVIALVSLQVASIGFYFTKCSLMERVLLIVGMLLLLVFVPVHNYAFFVTGVGLFSLVTLWQLRKRKVITKEAQPNS